MGDKFLVPLFLRNLGIGPGNGLSFKLTSEHEFNAKVTLRNNEERFVMEISRMTKDNSSDHFGIGNQETYSCTYTLPGEHCFCHNAVTYAYWFSYEGINYKLTHESRDIARVQIIDSINVESSFKIAMELISDKLVYFPMENHPVIPSFIKLEVLQVYDGINFDKFDLTIIKVLMITSNEINLETLLESHSFPLLEKIILVDSPSYISKYDDFFDYSTVEWLFRLGITLEYQVPKSHNSITLDSLIILCENDKIICELYLVNLTSAVLIQRCDPIRETVEFFNPVVTIVVNWKTQIGIISNELFLCTRKDAQYPVQTMIMTDNRISSLTIDYSSNTEEREFPNRNKITKSARKAAKHM